MRIPSRRVHLNAAAFGLPSVALHVTFSIEPSMMLIFFILLTVGGSVISNMLKQNQIKIPSINLYLKLSD
jgi:hypothetical protein